MVAGSAVFKIVVFADIHNIINYAKTISCVHTVYTHINDYKIFEVLFKQLESLTQATSVNYILSFIQTRQKNRF